MISPLLAMAVDDNKLFFAKEGLSQTIVLQQEKEIRGIFSRTESVENSLGVMVAEQFQSQVTLPTKDLPEWFGDDTKIHVEDGTGILHEYKIEKSQEDSMLARTHIWLKSVGARGVPV